MTTALVTGATGFIGGNLARALRDAGVSVRALVRSSSNTEQLERLGVSLHVGSFADADSLQSAVEGVDYVYHLAAMTAARRASQQLHVNGHGTARLVAAATQVKRPPVFLYMSSIAAAGPIARGLLRTESDRAVPVSNYGRSKRAGEVAVMRASERLPATILRPGVVFGEDNQDMLPVFRSIYRLRNHVIPSLSPPPLSFIHIADLIEITMRAADRGRRTSPQSRVNGHGVYYAVCPEYPDYAHLGRMLRPLLDRPFAPLVFLAQPLPWVMGAIGELFNQISGKLQTLNIDKIREACASSWACSSHAVARDLDFRFEYSLTERLASAVKWYRDHDWL